MEGTNTWRSLTEKETSGQKNVIPIALLLTQKRDGTYKCRAIVLGNRCVPNSDEQLYAPVVSMVALRTMLTIAAREGDSIRVFDLDNAFLNAELSGPPVYVSIPQIWRGKTEKPVERLLMALYGLPQSPKLWYLKHADEL